MPGSDLKEQQPVAWQVRCLDSSANEWQQCSRDLFEKHPTHDPKYWEFRELYDRASPVAQGWQPIATAPSIELLLVRFKGEVRLARKYVGGNPAAAWVDDHQQPLREPTHWMPLPEPPQ